MSAHSQTDQPNRKLGPTAVIDRDRLRKSYRYFDRAEFGGLKLQLDLESNTMVRFNLCLLAVIGFSMLVGVYSVNETSTLESYIVLMADDGGVGTSDVTTTASRYAALVAKAMQATSGGFGAFGDGDSSTGIQYVYDSVCTGFSVKMTAAAAAYTKEEPGVLGVMLDHASDPQTTHTPEFLGLSTLQGLWPKSKFGDDVIVGLLDTGVWPESASFSDKGLGPIPSRWKGICQTGTRFSRLNCNKKLIGARYYSKGHEAVEGPLDLTKYIRSARDTNGHGSHTASTAAGSPVEGASLNGLAAGRAARGMAPKARVAVYKTCWRRCYDSDTLAAYDQAVKDGVDVLSVSVGGSPQNYHLESNSVGSFGAMKKGIFVAASAGNNGGRSGTVANIAPWVITVAASTVDRIFHANVRLGNGKLYQGKSWTPSARTTAPLILGSKATAIPNPSAKFCVAGSLTPALVKGKIVVCYSGSTLASQKGVAVLAAGGVGMIVINSGDDPEQHHAIPTVEIGTGSVAIYNYALLTTKPTATLYAQTILGVKPAPVMASFSSRGPSRINPKILKPDITGPGVDILAAWTEQTSPTELTAVKSRVKFNIISGTSMSTPHIAGLGALLKGANRLWSPAAIKSALMTTATVYDNRNKLITDQWQPGVNANPFDYGAGHVRPERALYPGLIYDITPAEYVNFLCAYGYSAAQVQIFTGVRVTCPRIPVRVEDLNYPSFSATFRNSPAPITTKFTRTVTNVGAVTSTYRVSVQAPRGVTITVTPNILYFNRLAKKRTFVVTVKTIGAPATAFGSITWSNGVRFVRSPVVITPAV